LQQAQHALGLLKIAPDIGDGRLLAPRQAKGQGGVQLVFKGKRMWATACSSPRVRGEAG
jgi:hypothetical protein